MSQEQNYGQIISVGTEKRPIGFSAPMLGVVSSVYTLMDYAGAPIPPELIATALCQDGKTYGWSQPPNVAEYGLPTDGKDYKPYQAFAWIGIDLNEQEKHNCYLWRNVARQPEAKSYPGTFAAAVSLGASIMRNAVRVGYITDDKCEETTDVNGNTFMTLPPRLQAYHMSLIELYAARNTKQADQPQLVDKAGQVRLSMSAILAELEPEQVAALERWNFLFADCPHQMPQVTPAKMQTCGVGYDHQSFRRLPYELAIGQTMAPEQLAEIEGSELVRQLREDRTSTPVAPAF